MVTTNEAERAAYLAQRNRAEQRIKESMQLCTQTARFVKETKDLRVRADRMQVEWETRHDKCSDKPAPRPRKEGREASSRSSSPGSTPPSSPIPDHYPSVDCCPQPPQSQAPPVWPAPAQAPAPSQRRRPGRSKSVSLCSALGQRVATPSRSIRERMGLMPKSKQQQLERDEKRDLTDMQMHSILRSEWDELASGTWKSPSTSILGRLRRDQQFNEQFGLPAQLQRWQAGEKDDQLQYEHELNHESLYLVANLPELPHRPLAGAKLRDKLERAGAAAEWAVEGKKSRSRPGSRASSRASSRPPSSLAGRRSAMAIHPADGLPGQALHEELQSCSSGERARDSRDQRPSSAASFHAGSAAELSQVDHPALVVGGVETPIVRVHKAWVIRNVPVQERKASAWKPAGSSAARGPALGEPVY